MQGRVADWVRRVTRAAVCGSSRDLAAYQCSVLCGKRSPGGAGTENCVTYLRLVFYLYTHCTQRRGGPRRDPPVTPTSQGSCRQHQGGHSVTRLTHGETSSHAEWDREGVIRYRRRRPLARALALPPPPPPIACDTAHHSPSPPSRRGRRRGRRRSHYHATTLRRPAPPIPKTAILSHMRVQLQPSGSLSPRRIASS